MTEPKPVRVLVPLRMVTAVPLLLLLLLLLPLPYFGGGSCSTMPYAHVAVMLPYLAVLLRHSLLARGGGEQRARRG